MWLTRSYLKCGLCRTAGLGIGDDKGIQWLSYRGKGTVKLTLTDLNLRAYPFDTQTIHVTVWHKSDWKLLPSRCCQGSDKPDQSYASTFDQKMLEASMESFQCCDTDPKQGERGYPHKWMPHVTRQGRGRVRPALKIGVRMSRKPEFFHFNYFGPLFLIGNLNGVALVIPPDDLPTRSQIILTLILTIVAFKMTISQMLPRLAYPTILDKCAKPHIRTSAEHCLCSLMVASLQVHHLDDDFDGNNDAWISSSVRRRTRSRFGHTEMDELGLQRVKCVLCD